MNRISIVSLCPLFLLLGLVSCGPQRELAYISDAERDSSQLIVATYANTIHPGDQLYIHVNSQFPEAVIPFNQETHVEATQMSRALQGRAVNNANAYKQQTTRKVLGYLVDQEGYIIFPVLGKMQVAGITYDSLQNYIGRRLIEGEYIMDPLVTVSPMNFRVSVIGEVARPRELHITGDRLTLLEALAMCGDITLYGQRDNVMVLREKNGKSVPIMVDLTKKTLFDSECYYLQQNDIVYVEPNKVRKHRANRGENWPKYFATGISVAVAVRNIWRAYIRINRLK